MTPLALRILRDAAQPTSRRRFTDTAGLLPHLRQEFHPFEVTAVRQEAVELGVEMVRGALPSVEWTFLPAERAWIEWSEPGGRVGALLVRNGDWADVIVADATRFCSLSIGQIAMRDQLLRVATDDDAALYRYDPSVSVRVVHGIAWRIYPFLLLINTPRVVGRRLHQPHRGLERRLRAAAGLQGSFPLQAWTEILLRCETVDESDAEARATGLTGRVCLHWVRAHRRRVHGIWTLISDYWAGDGSLGIKQSRYRLAPPVRRVAGGAA